MIPGWQMEAYERLRTEIVRSAVIDLNKALRKSERMGSICNEQIAMERWFLSRWGQFLCCDQGEYIIEKCHNSYKAILRSEALTLEKEDKIHKDYKSGMSKKEMMKKHGITNFQYYKVLRRYGR